MIGAILGDIIGSRFEFSKVRNKSEDFELFTDKCEFTDDTVLTIATMDSILNDIPFDKSYSYWGNKYPTCSYGSRFRDWLEEDIKEPYYSYGNGSAMRVSPIGFAYNDLKTVMDKAEESAIITHNHDEGIKGAEAVAVCIYLARHKTPKKIIKEIIETYFDYDLSRKLEDIRPYYQFNETCQGSVPESIICFLEGDGFEDCIRKAISLGGDTDTMGAIVGGIAEAYYGVSIHIFIKIYRYLPNEMILIIDKFYEKYCKEDIFQFDSPERAFVKLRPKNMDDLSIL